MRVNDTGKTARDECKRQLRTVRQEDGSMREQAGQDSSPQGLQVIPTTLQSHLQSPTMSLIRGALPSGVQQQLSCRCAGVHLRTAGA